MDKNENSVKANRILYIVIVAVLCVSAIVVGITAATQRGKKPSKEPAVTTEAPVSTKAPTTTAPVVTDAPNVLPSFVAPASGIVEKEHDLSVLVYSATMDDLRVHCGIDISANVGDDVLAAADGEITKVYTDPMMGNCIEISHKGDAVSIYKNLAFEHAEGIEVGTKVEKGQVISYIGDSAMIESAEEPHLHYELTVKGVSVDPLDYISSDSKLASLTGAEIYED